MAEAKSDRRGANATLLPVELLRGLTSAVDEVFATMISTLGLGTKLGDPCLLEPARDASPKVAEVGQAIHVEARVHIEGPLRGWISLSCTAQAAGDLARGLLRLHSTEVLTKAEVEDALGECANMIAGVMKTGMLDPRGSYTISTPRFRNGDDQRDCPRGTLAYRLCAGTLNAELWLDQRPDGA
ncbi:MAG TPA: chemotaxis protein CheX [Planctomycetota bacterium]|nr:chemotaxis protein CheX [Planctomycetota bacterium]